MINDTYGTVDSLIKFSISENFIGYSYCFGRAQAMVLLIILFINLTQKEIAVNFKYTKSHEKFSCIRRDSNPHLLAFMAGVLTNYTTYEV